MERRDAAQTQAVAQSVSVEAIQRDALAQSAIAQAVRQAQTQTVPQSADAQTRTVNFSKHALARVEERGIEITPDLMGKLADSVERAQEKGAKNILAFSNSQAFIVNIPYGRVITAMSGDEMRENVFTNIDGAVLL
ncbi:MAG: flagellar biosynthesis protein [Oscillibacter sp.]|nr:flagellar biosynthesis protein [Oscillibacter sp.]